MPITLNGTTGVVTPAATVGSITGMLKASSGVVAQAVAGSDYGQLTLATAQSASGTAVDFTGIPSWAKRITVMFRGVSTNGTSLPIIQLGSTTFTTTGYLNGYGAITGASANSQGSVTNGIVASYQNDAADTRYGTVVLNLFSGNSWVATGIMGSAVGDFWSSFAGFGTASGTLDRIRITTVNGTDTFDAGTINISYE